MIIWSGFQTGVDMSAIKAAKNNGFETSGYMPDGYRTEEGNKPEYAKLYNAVTDSSKSYTNRTMLNVVESDATIIFDYARSKGSKLTLDLCKIHLKPYLYITKNIDIEVIVNFIQLHQPNILNIAGNRESVCKGIEDKVYKIMDKVFKQLKQ
jgi:hypothetical protein